ncbi:uncharacterized protein LOC110863205 [Folsomia candida]|uniref:Uncharacterized protein n=1 Tax=Folsomia candida TaxID=158441 RepID=A0A226F1C1_FOLCA|nr:uncharacterized protein LOC110863205 [Folsomia candida]OXA62726.1 hypothetical protein Fcan01_02136 [Folsomia candida]
MRTFSIIKILTMGFAWFLSGLVVVSSMSVVATSYTSPSKYTSPVSPLNATCHRATDCTSDRFPTFLNCVKGRCSCDSHTFYDEYESICMIRHRSQCLIKRSPSQVVQPCVRFAQCAYPLDLNGNELRSAVHGSCQCLINKTPNSDGTCSKSSTIDSSPVMTMVFMTYIIFTASGVQFNS